jgi:hypothetical protein
MLLFEQTLFLAQSNTSPGESASKITSDGAAASDAIASAMDQLWQDVIGVGGVGGAGLYGAIANLGLLFAVGTLLIWVVQWAKALADDSTASPLSEAIWPLLVCALLANQGQLLSTCTIQLRDVINATNQAVLDQTSSSIRLKEAYKQVVTEGGAADLAESLVNQCASIVDPEQQKACLDRAKAQAQQVGGSLPNGPSNGFQKFLQGLGETFNTNIFQLAVRGWLIAFGIAFQWIVEISLLLTGLLGPLAVGGSLLPIGQKSIFAWLTGFFSVGMVKLSFNIISGLVATLVLNAEQNDPMIFAFATGLLAPILSLVLAAGGGMAVFNGLSSIASFGVRSILPIR